jgi:hypothetical protein
VAASGHLDGSRSALLPIVQALVDEHVRESPAVMEVLGSLSEYPAEQQEFLTLVTAHVLDDLTEAVRQGAA